MARGNSNEDISNKAVVLMLIAVILVSVVSLGVYINAISNAQPEMISKSEGQVKFTIDGNMSEQQTEPSTSDGNVGLTIEN
jgi:cytochrome c-type biogenesis protein CcmH/NrfG